MTTDIINWRVKPEMKKTLSILLALILSLSAFATAYATQAQPNGFTEIDSVEALNEVRSNLDGKYILTQSIDLSDVADWQAIGSQDAPFTGEFDGNGYSIIGMNTTTSLFGEVKEAAIKNLGITDCNVYYNADDVATSGCTGAFAAQSFDSTFKNCFTSGSIKAYVSAGMVSMATYANAGGFTGFAKDTSFINCYNTADIHLDFDKVSSAELGGIAGGANNCTFISCYNTGALSAACTVYNPNAYKNLYYGGLVGITYETTKLENCYFIDSMENAIGKTAETPDGTCALAASQMKTQEAFTGFDFADTWEIFDDSYPTLKVFNKIKIETPEENPDYGQGQNPDENPDDKQEQEPNKPVKLPDINIELLYKQTVPVFADNSVEITAWESADESIAVITDDGQVEGVGTGATSIEITTENGETATVNVNVKYTFLQKIIIIVFFGWIWY